MFLREISYSHQGALLFNKKYSKDSNILKYYYNLK